MIFMALFVHSAGGLLRVPAICIVVVGCAGKRFASCCSWSCIRSVLAVTHVALRVHGLLGALRAPCIFLLGSMLLYVYMVFLALFALSWWLASGPRRLYHGGRLRGQALRQLLFVAAHMLPLLVVLGTVMAYIVAHCFALVFGHGTGGNP